MWAWRVRPYAGRVASLSTERTLTSNEPPGNARADLLSYHRGAERSSSRIAPEAAVGGLIATVKEGDSIAINGHKRLLLLSVPEDEIARRRAAWKPPSPATRAACWPSTTQMWSAR